MHVDIMNDTTHLIATPHVYMFAHIILMFDYGYLNINKQVHGIQLNQNNSQIDQRRTKCFQTKIPNLWYLIFIQPTKVHSCIFL